MGCKVCGKPKPRRNKEFCSNKCRNEYNAKHRRVRCVDCGEYYVPDNGSIRCNSCLAKYREEKKEVCPICGKEYVKRRFDQCACSKKCGVMFRKLYPKVRTIDIVRPREFTPDTVFLVHEYFAFGENIIQIARQLNRCESDIEKALSIQLSETERNLIAENASIRLKRKVLPSDIR